MSKIDTLKELLYNNKSFKTKAAKELGVSISTVYHYLNCDRLINEETLMKINNLIDRLDANFSKRVDKQVIKNERGMRLYNTMLLVLIEKGNVEVIEEQKRVQIFINDNYNK